MMDREAPTLCWGCARALGGCSWSSGEFLPVEGWMALPTCQMEITSRGILVTESYYVYGCPEYLPG